MLKVRASGRRRHIALIGEDGLENRAEERRRLAWPACYGGGGAEPTVADANVVLGALAEILWPALRSTARAAGRRRRGWARRWPRCRGRGRACCASSTRRWRSICGSRCRSRDRTRANLRWSPLAAPDRCTRRRWRKVSASDRAGPALSRIELRHGDAADECAPLLSQIRGGRAQSLFRNSAGMNEIFGELEAAGTGGGKRRGI